MISTSKKFLYIHIPRNGGNSIENSFEDWCLPLEERLDKAKPFSGRHRSLEHYNRTYDLNSYFIFATVRHPIRRMVSIFNWGNQIAKPAKGVGWSNDDFNEWVLSEEWKRGITTYGGKVFVLSPFECTQKRWLTINGVMSVSSWYKLETLYKEWNSICRTTIGKKVPIQRLHTTEYPSIDISKESKDILYEHFKEDFDTFHYREV